MTEPAGAREEQPSLAAVGEDLEAEEVRTLRERVLNVIGHELMTPVSTIRGLATALSRAEEASREVLIASLLRSTERLETLVHDLLLASDVETVLPTAHPEPVDLAQAVRASWSGWQRIEVDIPEGLRVLMTPTALERALGHVLRNASAYGGEPVAVAATRSDDGVAVDIDSPGDALHPEEVRLAVEPFYRGERAVMSAPGLGLGLPVARALVTHAGGRLTVAELPSGGLRTQLVLPAAPPIEGGSDG